MKENSIKNERSFIEQYVKILERFSNENVIYGSTVGMTLEKYKDLQLSAEHILSDYKRVLKENEELKFKERSRIIGEYGDAEIHDVINKTLSNDYISVQKVKDKIEEYKNMLKTCNKAKNIDRIKAINERILELQELLEGGKEKTADELFDDLGLWLERETPFDFEVKNDDDKVIKFNKERREIACFNYYDGFEYLTLQELQAINKKCQELGWLKED